MEHISRDNTSKREQGDKLLKLAIVKWLEAGKIEFIERTLRPAQDDGDELDGGFTEQWG